MVDFVPISGNFVHLSSLSTYGGPRLCTCVVSGNFSSTYLMLDLFAAETIGIYS